MEVEQTNEMKPSSPKTNAYPTHKRPSLKILVANWKGVDLLSFGILLFLLGLSVDSVYEFQNTKHYLPWLIMSIMLTIGTVWCLILAWRFRATSRTQLNAALLVCFFSTAAADTSRFWLDSTSHKFPFLGWFCFFCILYVYWSGTTVRHQKLT
jgi:fucose 4-O-acetylase-like acetyltransferase